MKKFTAVLLTLLIASSLTQLGAAKPAQPTLTQSEEATGVSGTDKTLTCATYTGGHVYKFYKEVTEVNVGVVNNVLTLSSPQKTDSGSYTCTDTDNSDGALSDKSEPVVINFIDKPALTFGSPEPVDGDPLKLTCTTAAKAGVTLTFKYTFKKDGSIISGSTPVADSKFDLPSYAIGTDDGSYTCEVTVDTLPFASDPLDLALKPQTPTLTQSGKATDVAGTEKKLTCTTASKGVNFDYTFNKDNKVVTTGKIAANVLTLSSPATTDSGSYTCTVTAKDSGAVSAESTAVDIKFTECAAKKWGDACNDDCDPNCGGDGSCDKVNGHCEECKAGTKGDKCETTCDPAKWGIAGCKECSENCGGDGSCNDDDGHCTNKCKPGFKDDLCDTPCDAGKWGAECTSSCDANCGGDGSCDNVNGHCTHGCKTSFKGALCDTKCTDGKWGDGGCNACNENCGDDGSCDAANGHCTHGCKQGFNGDQCETADGSVTPKSDPLEDQKKAANDLRCGKYKDSTNCDDKHNAANAATSQEDFCRAFDELVKCLQEKCEEAEFQTKIDKTYERVTCGCTTLFASLGLIVLAFIASLAGSN